MSNRAIAIYLVIALSFIGMVSQSTAQDKSSKDRSIHIEHDLEPGKIRMAYLDGDKTRTVRRGSTVRIRKAPLAVVITETNSALYDCTMNTEKVDVPELAHVKSYLENAGPYLPGIAEISFQSETWSSDSFDINEVNNVRKYIDTLDMGIHGKNGLNHILFQTIGVLEEMSATNSTADSAQDSLRKSACDESDNDETNENECNRIKGTRDIFDAYKYLASVKFDLDKTIEDRQEKENDKLLADMKKIQARIDQILKERESVVTGIHRLKSLVSRVVEAKDEISCEPVSFEWNAGRSVKVKVTPRSEVELAQVASHGGFEYDFTVQPQWRVRPQVGLALIAAPGAKHETFSTKANGDGFEIIKKGFDDNRFNYGLVLGLSWSQPYSDKGFNLWLPEFTINPLEDGKAFGIGGGISWRIVKFGFGRIWTQHTVLDDQNVGDIIDSEDSLKTGDSYGGGDWYFSFSVTGWPPFVQ